MEAWVIGKYVRTAIYNSETITTTITYPKHVFGVVYIERNITENY
jgi:hypothetical protein